MRKHSSADARLGGARKPNLPKPTTGIWFRTREVLASDAQPLDFRLQSGALYPEAMGCPCGSGDQTVSLPHHTDDELPFRTFERVFRRAGIRVRLQLCEWCSQCRPFRENDGSLD